MGFAEVGNQRSSSISNIKYRMQDAWQKSELVLRAYELTLETNCWYALRGPINLEVLGDIRLLGALEQFAPCYSLGGPPQQKDMGNAVDRPVPTGGCGGVTPPRHNLCQHRTKSGVSVGKQANLPFTSVKCKSLRVYRQNAMLPYN